MYDMEPGVKAEASPPSANGKPSSPTKSDAVKSKARSKRSDIDEASKRRCVSTACIACRKRKSKCDGNLPACAACSSVYGTECVYDPNSDHRRKGVYKKDLDNLKTRNSTLQTLIQALLNSPEDDVPELVRQIRTCESLDKVAESIIAKENGVEEDQNGVAFIADSPNDGQLSFEKQLSSKLGQLRLDDGSLRYIGGTSNLLYLAASMENGDTGEGDFSHPIHYQQEEPIVSWTRVTKDAQLIRHLLEMYFTWHYTFFTTLSRNLFERDFNLGKHACESSTKKNVYCTSLLVNVMLALGCHFTSYRDAREDPDDSATAGDHFFREAKRLLMEDDEYERPRLATVQALALMSVREAGCGREGKGWAYSGISFRMACDLGLNFQSSGLVTKDRISDQAEEDARRITFWGCFLFDKCWSNYLGRIPHFQTSSNITIPKFEIIPGEDADLWSPYSDSGHSQAHSQPSRVRAVALQISALCDINCDVMKYFYHPQQMEKPISKQLELKRSSEIHTRLESWKRELPKELDPREGGLSSVLVMHMLFQLLYIHLFRAFLKYDPKSSPLPANVSPRKLCTQAAGTISKLLRLYKRSYGLRQICNIAVYIAHSACTIHLLNLPDKNAKRDIVHGVKHLEEIAEGWICARRTLYVLSDQSRQWNIELPEEAATVLARTDLKYGPLTPPKTSNAPSPSDQIISSVQTQPMSWTNGQNYHASDKPFMDMTGLATNGTSYQGIQSQDYNTLTPYGPERSYMQPPSTMPPHTTMPAYSIPASQPLAPMQNFAETRNMPSFNQSVPQHNFNGNKLPPFNEGSPQQLVNGSQRKHNQDVMPHQPHPYSQQDPQQRRQHHQQAPTSQQRRPSYIPTSSDPMFGGVEALLRESQEWWVKDQAQVASGFPNWGLESSLHRMKSTSSSSADPLQQQRRQSVTNEVLHNASAPPNHGIPMKTSGSPEHFGHLPHDYNETDWYQ